MTTWKRRFGPSLFLGLALQAGTAFGQAGETVRIAVIDPMSGFAAAAGANALHIFQFLAERESKSNPARVKYEVVAFDNKMSPQETLSTLKAAADQGFRYVTQGIGSAAGLALMDAIGKHNERNPGKEIVYLNHNAIDPTMTNEACNFWHFRFEPDVSMKMEILTSAIKDTPSIKKVYLINQNYALGHQAVKYAREMLGRKRPDVQIVGDDLHPIGQTKDFTPYVVKIKQSGADAVITANWGPDIALLFKAAKDAGLDVAFYTYAAGGPGAPALLGDYGLGKVKYVGTAYTNMPGEATQIRQAFEARYKEDFTIPSAIAIYKSLSAAIAKAKSTDPVKVAKALEGMSVKTSIGEVTLRASDHQLQQALYLVSWGKTDKQNPDGREGTGNTWIGEKLYASYVSSTPTTCQMKRPN